ncbi:synaptosomal-associated protein 47-like [Actinia tenebrosa]|uniref:Synaptosomal-associated protein 47 n=1 Tax=Actinia tenebrosa TaxID=6105 RepID=A0A6P8HSR9_ACTTE|nr:synaptosomal-associated protein 47-like [Actinia tenebrosa]
MASIGKWKASYYCDSKRSWIPGIFQVCPQFIRFTEEIPKSTNDIIDLTINFDEFVELKKETTAIFYTALTIRCTNNKYWFASFPSCSHVYNILEHFWRERLLSGNDSSAQQGSGGQKLLEILHDSANCLSSTSKTLETQGQQIDNACRTMNKLHNDLRVAETIISSMDSWLNQWDLHVPEVVINVPKQGSEMEKMELPVLYAASEKEKHISGSLVLSSKVLEILDIQRNPVYSFTAREVSEVRVHTPFEMTLIKSEIGKPEVCVHLISAKLIKVMPHINVMLGPKLNFDEPPDSVAMTTASSHNDTDELLANLKLDEIEKQKKMQKASSAMGNRGAKTVSETEAAQMTKILQDMKSMAVGIQDEQNRQLGMLDLLSDSVDKANERIRKDARTIKRLT